MSRPKRRLAVVFGGRSAEHEISVISARAVLEALDAERYDVLTIGIDKEGGWHRLPALPGRTGGALPAVAIAAFVTHSTGKVVLVLVIYFVVSNVIYNFVSPKVFGDAVNLSPMLIIIAFVIGGYLGGILGLFVAVPVAATLRILFLYAYQRVDS